MCVFHVFKNVQMVPNRATDHICTDTDNYVNVLSTIKKEKKKKSIA